MSAARRVKGLTARRYRLLIGLAIVAMAMSLAATQPWRSRESSLRQSPDAPLPSLVDKTTLDELATTDTGIDRTHLADNLTPPTNKWFSGFALQSQPQPGYNYPTSFKPNDDGFEFGLPEVRAGPTVISGHHAPDIVVTIAGATSYKLTYYDELVVELTYFGANGEIASVRVASGLPYVYLTAKQPVDVSFTGEAEPQDGWTRISSNDRSYGVNTTAMANNFSLAAGMYASFFGAPSQSALSEVRDYADAIVTSGTVTYARRDDLFATTLRYDTLEDKPVLFARLPHQQEPDGTANLTYRSILGDMTTDTGNEFSFTAPVVPVMDKLDLSRLTNEQTDLLREQLRRDVATYQDRQDTYFGGKQLYRMAQLLTIAKQLDETAAAETARATLRSQLEDWLAVGESEPKSFLYDPAMLGIVGNEASFGSDKEFNDHHFHYGYFIYAAAVLAEYDQDFLAAHRDAVNLLVADIANYNVDELLPLRRSFDPYAGHSWASGTAPFKDGNNQESTSEAINAWVGVSLWADSTDNDALKLQADWLLSLEYRTAQVYWLLQSRPHPEYLAAYASPIASIVWGGKREYATFFSDEPNAKLAIQLLPLSPTMKRVATPLSEELFAGTLTADTYGDHILMARPDATLEQAISLPDTVIDDGNSRTYLYAYILAP